jgi:hypothetical protein
MDRADKLHQLNLELHQVQECTEPMSFFERQLFLSDIFSTLEILNSGYPPDQPKES